MCYFVFVAFPSVWLSCCCGFNLREYVLSALLVLLRLAAFFARNGDCCDEGQASAKSCSAREPHSISATTSHTTCLNRTTARQISPSNNDTKFALSTMTPCLENT